MISWAFSARMHLTTVYFYTRIMFSYIAVQLGKKQDSSLTLQTEITFLYRKG